MPLSISMILFLIVHWLPMLPNQKASIVGRVEGVKLNRDERDSLRISVDEIVNQIKPKPNPRLFQVFFSPVVKTQAGSEEQLRAQVGCSANSDSAKSDFDKKKCREASKRADEQPGTWFFLPNFRFLILNYYCHSVTALTELTKCYFKNPCLLSIWVYPLLLSLVYIPCLQTPITVRIFKRFSTEVNEIQDEEGVKSVAPLPYSPHHTCNCIIWGGGP